MTKSERTVPRSVPDQSAVLLFDAADGTRFIVEVQIGAADTDQP
ncbi:hypothetical protein [Sinomonas soli]